MTSFLSSFFIKIALISVVDVLIIRINRFVPVDIQYLEPLGL
jgi:hypothetical protein